MNPIDSRIALLVPSCDAYADVWPPLFRALALYWPANRFPKYLVSNLLTPDIEGLQVICVGADVSWSDNLIRALDSVAEPYVLLNIDDLILHAPVEHAAVISIMSRFIEADGNYLRLNPTPPGTCTVGDVDVVPVGDFYRSSTVFSLWRKEVLLAVLRGGETAWQFEVEGSHRTDVFAGWFAARRPLLQYVNLVVKGKVDPRALAVLRRCGVRYQSSRPVLSHGQLFRLWLREKRSRGFGLLPPKLRRSIRSVFRPV